VPARIGQEQHLKYCEVIYDVGEMKEHSQFEVLEVLEISGVVVSTSWMATEFLLVYVSVLDCPRA